MACTFESYGIQNHRNLEKDLFGCTTGKTKDSRERRLSSFLFFLWNALRATPTA
jgi:hypothetical protein